MVFTGGNDRVERRSDSNNREDGIFSDNFGGLNLTASDLNCPYEDSPQLINCDIDVSGKVVKRKGTKLLLEEAKTGKKGYTLLSFVTGLRYTFLLEKLGKDATIYEVNNDTITSVISKTNVWDDLAEDIRANYVRTTEVAPRVIMTTGVNQPVQFKFYEQQRIATGTATNFAFTNAEVFENISLTNAVFYKNRTMFTPTSVSYSGGTVTINDASVVADDVIDVVMVVWQHIVEAIYLEGKRISQQVTRFHVTKTDQNVEIPEELRWDFVVDYPSNQLYGYRVYQTDQWNDTFTFDTTQTPATNSEYCHGIGARYDQTAGGTVTPSPLFVTFGDIIGTGTNDPTEIFIARRFDLNKYLNGGVDIAGDDLKVFLNDSEQTQRTTNASAGSYGDWGLIDNAGAFVTSTATVARFIWFESGAQMGIEYDGKVEIVHTSTDFIGSAATTTVNDISDGGCEPAYGLGLFADYFSGSFPRNVAIFENRLVYSGFPANPLRVIFSEVGDKYKLLKPYRHFQIDQAHTGAEDAIDIPLQGRADDFITGLVTWQRSLFVFTRQAVYRISGGENGFTNTSKFVRLISTNGLVNAYSVTVTEKSILYLSDFGVYDLILGIDSEDFTANEKSIKIRQVFGSTRQVNREPLAWMTYDSINQKVYLGLPVNELDYTSFKLYVYHVFREAWTEYQQLGGFNTYYGLVYSDRTSGGGFLLSIVGYRDGSDIPTNRCFVSTEADDYLDYIESFTGDNSTVNFNLSFDQRLITHTTVDTVYDYPISVEASDDDEGFFTIPIQSVQDITVELETASGSGTYDTLTINTDYVKRPNGYLYLRNNPGDSRTLRIRSRVPNTDSEVTRAFYGINSALSIHEPVAVFVDNIYQVSGTDYDMDTNSGTYRVEFTTAPATSTVIKTGQIYQALYTSPALTLQTFTRLKRSKFIYIYFDNEIGRDIFTNADVNSSSSQDAEALVGHYKQRLNANISLKLESDFDGSVEYDLYSFSSLLFDNSLFDIFPSANQFRRYVLFKEALLGIGYSYQLLVWSFDETAFKLSAYQVSPMLHAERFINWTQGA